ncbi:MAG: hypothetical protein KGL39_05550 [Patescibacteria group bacterium]|nr:hypothetical protein [Patescibacteria group bacterium]
MSEDWNAEVERIKSNVQHVINADRIDVRTGLILTDILTSMDKIATALDATTRATITLAEELTATIEALERLEKRVNGMAN